MSSTSAVLARMHCDTIAFKSDPGPSQGNMTLVYDVGLRGPKLSFKLACIMSVLCPYILFDET